MLFPIGDTQVKNGHKPYVSYSFIVLNIFIFLYQISLSQQGLTTFYYSFGTVPLEITNGISYHTLISSMFLHGSIMHLIGNMLFLYVFADNIEARVGSYIFIIFYLLGGVAATLGHILSEPLSNVPSLGASGAISAVMGAYLVLFPRSRVKLLFVPFLRTFSVSAIYFLAAWFVFQLGTGLLMASTEDPQQGGGTAWWAHIGGFVFGLLAALILRRFFHDHEAEGGSYA